MSMRTSKSHRNLNKTKFVLWLTVFFATIYFVCHKFSSNQLYKAWNTQVQIPLDPVEPKSSYKRNIEAIQSICGDLCDTSGPLESPGAPQNKRIYSIKKRVDCRRLFEAQGSLPKISNLPPAQIPQEIYSHFTYQNRIQIRGFYLNNAGQSSPNKEVHWSKEKIESMMASYRRYGPSEKHFVGGYGVGQTKDLEFVLRNVTSLVGKRVIVVGSMSPWVEVLALGNGAAEVTTLEYGKIRSDHDTIKTLTPDEFDTKYLTGSLEPFDVILSYSSLEHSGLGRYGDSLNPWGDIMTMAKLHCAASKDAVAIIGVPFDTTGGDSIEFNAHKCYGPLLLSHLFTNWKVEWSSEPKGTQHVCSYAKHHGIYVAKKL